MGAGKGQYRVGGPCSAPAGGGTSNPAGSSTGEPAWAQPSWGPGWLGSWPGRCVWGERGRDLSGSLLAGANPCPRLLLGVTGGRWHGALAGVGGCADPVSLASPSRVLAHREQCGCSISLCRAGWGWATKEGTRACLSLCLPVSSCELPQLHPRAAPASHTLFE